MTLKGGAAQACAACKYQRRKCSPECPLAPYFPSDHPKLFQNAHKLFGVRNILGILKHLDETQKPEAMRSIIYQSNMRDRYPVLGCCAVISHLRWQLQIVKEELNFVKSQIRHCRRHQLNDDGSRSDLGMCRPHMNAVPVYDQSGLTSLSATQKEAIFDPNCFDIKDNSANPLLFQNPFGDINCFQEQVQSFDDIQLLFAAMDESSQEESLKDPTLYMEPVAEKELKSPAASFGLTNPK